MPLTNAERQARYRERIKQLAERGVMSPAQVRLLSDTRRHLREWRRSIASFDEGYMRLFTNHVDTSSEHVARLKQLIVQNEALLAQYDPDGMTTDGNIELGDIAPERSSNLWPNRWVTYSLDRHGRADKLCVYDAEGDAQRDSRRVGRGLGRVADDMWSITPIPTRIVYALVQKMPNGWWKGLVAGWNDLPEQYAPTKDSILSELSQVSRDYIAQRRERDLPIHPSMEVRVANWECVAIPFDSLAVR